jgi:DNA primase
MSAPWIDFADLQSRLDFAAVLRHYGVELKVKKGDQHQGFCPLPGHGGNRRSPSFSANLSRKIFHCFGCQKKGDCIAFVASMEGMDAESGQDIRKAALLLQERFLSESPPPPQRPSPKTVRKEDSESIPAQENTGRGATRPVIVNAPLDFELKGLDPEHPYLKERGFTAETIAHFGLGYCSRGSMQERIAIPIHDSQGKHVGYAGRLVDDQKIGEAHPKYKLPGSRERDGKSYEFHKSLILYNGFAAGGNLRDLIVVEGFPSVWWLWQCGFSAVVALMGSDCSDEQSKLIVASTVPSARIWLMPDGDSAGELCAQGAMPRLCPHRFVRWIRMPEGQQPTSLDRHQLSSFLNGSPDGTGGAHGD